MLALSSLSLSPMSLIGQMQRCFVILETSVYKRNVALIFSKPRRADFQSEFLPNLTHGRATEEGRRTGFLLLRYGCQLRASVLKTQQHMMQLKMSLV
jgi:hypothetical protein